MIEERGRLAEVHITVATGWVKGRGEAGILDVEHETRLVKAALLYADRVTLASPRVAPLASIASVLVADEKERGAIALQAVQVLPEGADIAKRVNALRRKKHKTIDELYLIRDLEGHLRKSGNDLAAKVEEVLTEAGVAELAAAMSVGVVELDPLGIEEPDGTSRLAYRLGDRLAEVVAPGATTYPLLDESTSSLLRSMIEEGVVTNAKLTSAIEPALATAWIGELEAFPDAEIEVVLAAREELSEPLVQFRAAVVKISRDMEATPLDEAWKQAANEAYRAEVEPALAELRELAEQKKVLSLLRHPDTLNLARKAGAAVFGLIGAQAAAVPALVGAAVGVAGDVGAAMLKRRGELTERQRENAFMFLYEADQRLRD